MRAVSSCQLTVIGIVASWKPASRQNMPRPDAYHFGPFSTALPSFAIVSLLAARTVIAPCLGAHREEFGGTGADLHWCRPSAARIRFAAETAARRSPGG